MDKDFLINLTKNLYRLTLLFPKKEPLRYKMRELASLVLTCPKKEDLENLDRYFEVAKFQNWVPFQDILAIQQDYANLSEGLKAHVPFQVAQKSIAKEEQKPAENGGLQPIAKALLERQQKILSILKEKGKAQVWEVKQVFPDVSKRTLRRDFEFLFKQGMIKRLGERNNTFYEI